MKNIWKLGIASAAMICAAAAVAAQEDAAQDDVANENLCEARDSSEFISVALCPEGLSEEDLSKAGTAICDDRMPCGVWFWTNEENLPEAAPENHDGLTQDQVTSALAVWVAEKSTLISIDALKNSQ